MALLQEPALDTEYEVRGNVWQYRFNSSAMYSVACILFILIRYMSILLLIISVYRPCTAFEHLTHSTTGNYGYFATNFTQESCHRFFMAAPVFKGIDFVHFPDPRELLSTFWLPCQLSRSWFHRRSWASGKLFPFLFYIIVSWSHSGPSILLTVGRGWQGLSLSYSPLRLQYNGSRISSTELVGSLYYELPQRYRVIHVLAITVDASFSVCV